MKFLILALFVAVASAAPLDDDTGPVELIVNGVPEGEPIDLSNVLDIKVKEHSNGVVVAATNLLHPYTAVGIAEAAAAAAAEIPEPVLVVEASESEVIAPVPVLLPAPVAPEVIFPESVVLPSPVAPEVVMPVPQPVVLPSPVAPEVSPESIPAVVISPPVVVPEPVVLPSPVAPEVIMPVPEPVALPSPVAPVVIPEPVVLPNPVAPEVVMPIPEPVVLPVPVAPEVVEPVPASLPNGEIFNDGTVSVTVNTPQEAGVFSTIQSWVSLVLNYFSDGVQTTHQIV